MNIIISSLVEEQLNLPSIFVQKSNLFCFKEEVVGIVRKRPVQFWSIINNASNRSWIVAFVSLAAKPDSLVTKDIVLSVKQAFTLLNLIIGTKLLSDNEECSSFFNGKEHINREVAGLLPPQNKHKQSELIPCDRCGSKKRETPPRFKKTPRRFTQNVGAFSGKYDWTRN